ncbi:MAG: SHOCT domain-containing protein [Oscillospiraceae bacterium]|nr:SHOCT domain-containing protein [Oscillospiraceae bacterium]
MKNQKIVIAAAGVNALLGAYYIVSYFSLWNLCDFLAYASVVVFVALTLKGNDVVKKIWFVPAAVLLLGCVIGWITGGYFEFLSAAWKSMLVSIVEIVALLFVGMWVKEVVAPAEASPVNEYATFNPQSINSTPASSSAIGGADKLKMYMDLLESGTITQEEFDAKKKQILGL